MKSTRKSWHRGAPLVLMVASGFAGLGYQIVWTQQSALWLGCEAAAVLAVVGAFFGGLAAGGLALGQRIERSAQPVRWYAACELVIPLWSLLLLFAFSPLSSWLQRMTGAQPDPAWQWLVAFCGTFLLFLPATAAMGATLPAMERLTTLMQCDGRSIAALYAGNTFGAVLGVLAAAFWLIPTVGLARTAALCMALNLACGVIALAVYRKAAEPAENARSDRSRARGVLWRLGITGFLGIGYEVLVVRVLSQVTENTVYTFAILLAVYLVGSAAGAAGYRRWLEGRDGPDGLADQLLTAAGVACLVGMASLWGAGRLRQWAVDAFGARLLAALAGEAVLALLAFGPPTIVMGALFSHLSHAARAAGVSFGRALGTNTLAAAAAPAVVGVIAVPALGTKAALQLIVLGYLAATSRRAWSTKAVLLPAAGTLAVALLAPTLTFVDVPEGGRLVRHEEGVSAAVSVVEDAGGVAYLRINNRDQEGSSATRYVDARQAWLPLLLHPAPRRALFLGLGTGVTASSAAEDPTLDVEAVELLPEVIRASTYFDGEKARARLRVTAADARRYVRVRERGYDVIVSDNFHPARSGSGALYTVEHFEILRDRLEEGGLFCQWLPLHQLDLETLRSIVQSFVTVYPRGWAMIANNSLETPVFALVARRDQNRLDLTAFRRRLSQVALPEQLARLGLEDDFAVLGSFVAGPEALRRFAGSAPANTDDHPIVAYRAPRITYVPEAKPRDRLLALLAELSLEPDELLVPTADQAWPGRLRAYWSARNRFIESGRDVRPLPRVEDMLAQVQRPLLSVLRTSPDFRPAYDPLLSMATALGRSDISGARALLAELARIQPARSEARQLLASLGGGASAVEATAR